MEFIDSKTIKLDTVVNELDKFVLDFVKILEKHADYVIMSGYVAILLGRSRATEDVDLFIRRLSFDEFKRLFDDLIKAGFECMPTSKAEIAYEDYLASRIPVRFFKDDPVPNVELKFATKPLDLASFKDKVTVLLAGRKLLISPLELQIAYKKLVLKSDKDVEDAVHLEKAYYDFIDVEKIKNYEALIKQYEQS